MTNTFNKGITSPILEQGQGYIFHAAGGDFKITGSHIETVTETNDTFKTLVAAGKTFDINESGISFYYDYNAKASVSKIQEGTVENFDTYLALSEKLTFLEDAAKELRLTYGKGEKSGALKEATTEIKSVKEAINEAKVSGLTVRFSFDAKENIYKAGNIEVPIETQDKLSEMFFASAYIKYADKKLIDAFQLACENFASYKVLDFVTEATKADVTVVTMRAENNAFIFRTNESTKLARFEKMLTTAAIEYVKEQTGADITEQFTDLLEDAKLNESKKEETKALYQEMLSFLYDQKGRLAEADRNLPDIKAADKLIGSEITKINQVIEALEEDTLTIEDGYIDATLKTKTEGLEEDAVIKVDSVEYAQAGKNDILTVFAGAKPFRVEKYKVNIASEDTV